MNDTPLALEGENFCPTCEASFGLEHTTCPTDGTDLVRLHLARDPLLGKKLGGRFVIEEKLGRGGMGAVYKATQTSIGRSVAIKVIETQKSDDRSMAKRFLREAKLASQLSQPNTISVLDFGQHDDGMLFLAMELVKGRALSSMIASEGGFSPARVHRIGVQLCDALEAAHGLSIIHRDLKPANIMILDDPPGRDLLKVLDFGLAKSLLGEGLSTTVTQSGAVMGTPLYMSPEAIQGQAGDERTDLYSVGVVLYELLSGSPPFVAENATKLFHEHLSSPPPPLPASVPPALSKVVLKLLAKRASDRYASASATRQALQDAAGSSVLSTSKPASSAPPATTVDGLANTEQGDQAVGLLSTIAVPTPVKTRARIAIALAAASAIAIALIIVLLQSDAPSGVERPSASPGDKETPTIHTLPAVVQAPAAAHVEAVDGGRTDAALDADISPPVPVQAARTDRNSRRSGTRSRTGERKTPDVKKTQTSPGLTAPAHQLPPE